MSPKAGEATIDFERTGEHGLGRVEVAGSELHLHDSLQTCAGNMVKKSKLEERITQMDHSEDLRKLLGDTESNFLAQHQHTKR